MNKDKNIKPRNTKGQPHGYWENYWTNGKLDSKGYYINGKKHGYWERYLGNGELLYTCVYNNGKRIGYVE